MKKRSLLFICISLIIAFTSSCSKKNELADLTMYNKYDDPEKAINIDVFEVDSIKSSQNPSVRIYYHVRFDLIKDTSMISKIIVLRDGAMVFNLSLSQPNVYSPTDLSVSRGNSYGYSFVFLLKSGTLSKQSKVYSVSVP